MQKRLYTDDELTRNFGKRQYFLAMNKKQRLKVLDYIRYVTQCNNNAVDWEAETRGMNDGDVYRYIRRAIAASGK